MPEQAPSLGLGDTPAAETNVGIETSRVPVVFTRDGEVFSSSRDIAAFFEKRHDDVLKAIDHLLVQEPSLRLRSFAESSYINELSNGRRYRYFDMTRDGFVLLAMGFTGAKALKWKLKYIEAFNIMEAELRARPMVDPMRAMNDPASLRDLLLTYTEKVLALEATNASLAPKAEALDRIATADGSFSLQEAAKMLQVRPKDLNAFMLQNGWLYRRAGSGSLLGYQAPTSAGLLEHKVVTYHQNDGIDHVREQVKVTPKGLAKLAKLMPGRFSIVPPEAA